MRLFFMVAAILVVGTACGDDSPMLTDTGTGGDTGAGDTGAGDTGLVDTGTADTGTDTGVADSGPPTCTPTASGIDFPTDEWDAVVVADGAMVNEPVGVTWNASGDLLISNSDSWLGSAEAVGNVLSLSGSTLGVFAMDDMLMGPAHLVWTEAITDSFEQGLLLATEDGDDSLFHVSADGMTVTSVTAAIEEPGELEMGPGGDWGTDLYITSRERSDSSTPNPYGLYSVASDGTMTEFDIMDGSTTITGAWSLEFGPGGGLGDDLYVGTIDDPGFSPGSMNAIYRVRASDGEATLFANEIRPLALAAPAPGGDFGEHLYVVTTNRIVRYDRGGTPEVFAEGIMSTAGLRFGSDGALYVAQPGAGRVIRISRCIAE